MPDAILSRRWCTRRATLENLKASGTRLVLGLRDVLDDPDVLRDEWERKEAFSALENIMVPQLVKGLSEAEATERATQLLDYMKIGHRADHRPPELSGGEQQRVAIARAVANAPLLLLADEPTGNLDPQTAGYVFDALEALVRQSGLSALIATHNYDLAARMNRRVTIADGKVKAA